MFGCSCWIREIIRSAMFPEQERQHRTRTRDRGKRTFRDTGRSNLNELGAVDNFRRRVDQRSRYEMHQQIARLKLSEFAIAVAVMPRDERRLLLDKGFGGTLGKVIEYFQHLVRPR